MWSNMQAISYLMHIKITMNIDHYLGYWSLWCSYNQSDQNNWSLMFHCKCVYRVRLPRPLITINLSLSIECSFCGGRSLYSRYTNLSLGLLIMITLIVIWGFKPSFCTINHNRPRRISCQFQSITIFAAKLNTDQLCDHDYRDGVLVGEAT